MIYLENEIPQNVGYVIPIGDLHYGDVAFKSKSLEKVRGYIDWIKERPEARVVLGGDLFNVATRDSITSPFEQKKDEFSKVIELFRPIKSQIAGAIDGNHEWRLIDFANFSLINEFCGILGVPYMGTAGVIVFKVGKRPRKTNGGMWDQYYKIFFHHTTGGGSLAGGGLNRVEKLKGIVEGCDAYCGFHNHGTFAKPQECYIPLIKSKKMELKRYWLIGCGGYLEYNDSYAERKMLTPQKLGSPRLRLDSSKHDLHVSL